MLVMVLVLSSGLLALLLIDPLRQRFYRRRHRQWNSYFEN